MTSKLWIYAGPDGHSEPVSSETLAELLSGGVLTGDTPVRPSDLLSWAPLFTWLPELGPPAPPPVPVAKGAWVDKSPHPWRRYLARMVDIVVIGTVTWALFGIVFGIIAPEAAVAFFAAFDGPAGRLADLMLTLLVTIPGSALMIGLTGVSVGKWLFGVKVVTPAGRPIGVLAALAREVRVWAMGLGLGVPLVSLFTLVGSYQSLSNDRHSAWDKPSRRIVLHRPMNTLQITLMVVSIPLLIAARVGLLILSRS